jgi:predicted SnoaL-like aldol condensation-catalyzing enzyme
MRNSDGGIPSQCASRDCRSIVSGHRLPVRHQTESGPIALLHPSACGGSISKQTNIETQQKMAEAVNQGKLEMLREVFAPDVLEHDPAPDQGHGPEGFISFFTHLREAFPDLKVAPEEMVADEEKIAIAYMITGTHKGARKSKRAACRLRNSTAPARSWSAGAAATNSEF